MAGEVKYTATLDDQVSPAIEKINAKLAEVKPKIDTAALSDVDNGLRRVLGGVGQMLSGSFKEGMNGVIEGISKMTGKTDAALKDMAIKAGAIGAAFGVGWKLGKLLDDALGISDKIAKNFDAIGSNPMDAVRDFRTNLIAASQVKFDALKKEFADLATAGKAVQDSIDLKAGMAGAVARSQGDAAGEEQAGVEQRASTKKRIMEETATLEQSIKTADETASQKRYVAEGVKRDLGGANPVAMQANIEAQEAEKTAKRTREEYSVKIQANRKAVGEIDIQEVDASTKKKARIEQEQTEEATAQADLKAENSKALFADFEKQQAAGAEVKKMEEENIGIVADKKAKQDEKVLALSVERKARLEKEVEAVNAVSQMTGSERIEMHKEERDKERTEKRNKRKEEKDLASALKVQEMIENGGLGGRKLTKHQQDVLDLQDKKRQIDIDEVNARNAKTALEDREKQRDLLAQKAEAVRDRQLAALIAIRDGLTIAV